MTKGLMVGAALGLTARRKRISPTGFGIRRGSLTLIPSRATRPAQWPWSGLQIPTVDSTGLALLDSRTIKISNNSVERPSSEQDLIWANAPTKEEAKTDDNRQSYQCHR